MKTRFVLSLIPLASLAAFVACVESAMAQQPPKVSAKAPSKTLPQPTSQPSAAAKPAVATIKINPQRVVDEALKRGRSASGAALQAQRSYLAWEQAKGVFDIQFKLTTGYEHNEGQTIMGQDNPVDRTFTVATSLEKKFFTGTTFSIGYDATRQSSTLSAFNAGNRDPQANLDSGTFGLRQAILRNTFGYADRLAVEIGETGVKSANETRDENLEDVALNAMTLFWNAYTAEQQLKENIAAREKYEQLVGNVRRKATFNLSSPGELPRIEAELEGADQRVKSSSSAYLNAIDQLLTAMQIPATGPVELEVPKELPPVPQLSAKSLEDLRLIRIAKSNLQVAEWSESRVRNSALPKLDLVARANSTGVDPETGRAYAEMVSGTRPTYYVGIEFETPIDSNLLRGQRADASVQRLQAENNFLTQQDTIRNQLSAAERAVAANFSIAKSSSDSVGYRERVVSQVEVAYRQGRQPLVELIRAYNELFSAQLERARAIGQYHISLNQLAAIRDELVAKPN